MNVGEYHKLLSRRPLSTISTSKDLWSVQITACQVLPRA